MTPSTITKYVPAKNWPETFTSQFNTMTLEITNNPNAYHRHRFACPRVVAHQLEAYDGSLLEASCKIIQDNNPESPNVLVQFSTSQCAKQTVIQRLATFLIYAMQ